LRPYLDHVRKYVFSRATYVPQMCDHGRSVIVAPSIDPLSPKNVEMDEATVRAILVHVGLVAGPAGRGARSFRREDGEISQVDRRADVMRAGPPPRWDTPLVVQVSRWDHLKDPVGVLEGFTRAGNGISPEDSELVLAGPGPDGAADDPEGGQVFERVAAHWRQLPEKYRRRVHLVNLPMADLRENAAMVNALQRHATVVVQKSLREGFGLTVTEAMWKGRPMIASAVGGIQDQVEDGVSGLLVKEPTDLDEFASHLKRVLQERGLGERLGKNARERVAKRFLMFRALGQYANLIEELDS
jgi:trehalose synthase